MCGYPHPFFGHQLKTLKLIMFIYIHSLFPQHWRFNDKMCYNSVVETYEVYLPVCLASTSKRQFCW